LSVIFFKIDRITLCAFETFINPQMKPNEKVTSDAVEVNANNSPTRQKPIVSELSFQGKPE
jgi:hypothetical protein